MNVASGYTLEAAELAALGVIALGLVVVVLTVVSVARRGARAQARTLHPSEFSSLTDD